MILSEVLDVIRSKEFALHCAALVERDASYNFLSLALKDESVKTFWDWGLTVEPLQPKQKITTNLSYDFDLSIKKSFFFKVRNRYFGNCKHRFFKISESL